MCLPLRHPCDSSVLLCAATVSGLLLQVNKRVAAEALLQQAAEQEAPTDTSNKKRKTLPNVLEDDRFKAMFEDPSFAVDETADEYKFHHPNAGMTSGFVLQRTVYLTKRWAADLVLLSERLRISIRFTIQMLV